jgi:SM-20-related protein
MIRLDSIAQSKLLTEPYCWAEVDGLFSPEDAAALAGSFPSDHFKTEGGQDKERGWAYEARELLAMGVSDPSFPESLNPAWRQLAMDLASAGYREAMSTLTGLDLREVPVEANVFHYGPGSWLGPHVDLIDKLVTHVLYFNREWRSRDGGCLQILRSLDSPEAVAEISPIVGRSAVIVRSDASWHGVPRVRRAVRLSRRSLAVTFYRPGSVSTMWPPGASPVLHDTKFDDRGMNLLKRIRDWLPWPLERYF